MSWLGLRMGRIPDYSTRIQSLPPLASQLPPRTMKPLLLALALGLLTGCASYDYHLAVKNVGTEEVWCSLVSSSKGMAQEPGRLIPGSEKTFSGPFRVPYRDQWTVEWKTASGQVVTLKRDLTQAFPKTFAGYLVFTIDKDQNLKYLTEPFSGK